MASSLDSGCPVLSDLLSVREKGLLVALLGPHCKLVASAVTQVLVAKQTPSGNLGWSCLCCGVVCLIEDHSMHSHFLRLYSVKQAKLLWEQELYTPFKYTATCAFFHTFPSDGHQAGLNFADETEAKRLCEAVENIQRTQEKSGWIKMTYADKEDGSTGSRPEQGRSETSDSAESGMESLNRLYQGKYINMHRPSTIVTPTPDVSRELDPAMRKLLRQAGLSEGDLKDKSISEVVHCIVNNLGGLEAVRREMKNRGPAYQTLPRAAGASISLSLMKGPLPPVPSVTRSMASQQVSKKGTKTESPLPSWIPPPPSVPAPPAPERIKKSISFRPAGSPSAAEPGLILTALRDAFSQNQHPHQEQDTGVRL